MKSLRVPLLALALAVGCKAKADPNAPLTAATDSAKAGSTLAIPVVGEPVRKGDLVLTVSATGQLESAATANVNSETDGIVNVVKAHPGDLVHAGDTLAALDPASLDLDVRSAQAALDQDQVRYNSDVHTDSVVEGTVRPERRRFLQAQDGIASAQVQLDKAQLARKHAVVRAPFDGVIENVGVAVGDHIGAGTAVATVVDMKHLRVEAVVLEHDLPLLRVGGDAWVTVAAFPDKPVHGTISAILPLVDTVTRAGRALINIDGNGELRPGMYADVQLEATRLHDRIIVPARAIIERDNRPLVFVADSGQAEWVYVNAGRSNGRETEILPDSATGEIPLKPGQVVLTEGHLTLTHQAPIKLVMKRESSADDQP